MANKRWKDAAHHRSSGKCQSEQQWFYDWILGRPRGIGRGCFLTAAGRVWSWDHSSRVFLGIVRSCLQVTLAVRGSNLGSSPSCTTCSLCDLRHVICLHQSPYLEREGQIGSHLTGFFLWGMKDLVWVKHLEYSWAVNTLIFIVLFLLSLLLDIVVRTPTA